MSTTKYVIVTDSSCDLKHFATAPNVSFLRAPLLLQVGEKEFVDDTNLDVAGFMAEMKAFHGKTSSAAPSPDAYLSAYRQGDEVFAITISSKLSGSYNSAMTALDMIKEECPEKKVHVIDSCMAGSGLTLLVYKLNKYMREGLSFEEIVEKIENYRKHVNLLFLLESMDNLIKNGRVSALQGKLAGMLGIRILGGASKFGDLEVLHKIRGRDASYKKMLKEMDENGFTGKEVSICHCFNEEKANYLKESILAKFPNCKIDIMPTGGLCSYYAENGGIILAYV